MTAQYLQQPEPSPHGHIYGTVDYDKAKNAYTIKAEPAVMELCKRVFPGCARGRGADASFPATRRAVGDLNWIMLRYPLSIECEAQFAADRERAIAHASRRDENQNVGPAVVPATFRGELRKYQAEGVSYLTANERALLADDMGLGKTVTALAAMATAEAMPTLLVAPPSVRLQWEREATRFLNIRGQGTLLGELVHHVKGSKPYPLPDVPLYITHYGLLRHWVDALREVGIKLLICDEIQELRHIGTQKYSAASLLAGDSQYVWGLSGTPIHNYGDEMWSVLNIIDFNCLGDRESFTREWCVGYGSKVVEKPDVLGDHLRREGLMLRRLKADVLGELPPKRRVVVNIDHDENLYASRIAHAVKLAGGYSEIKDWAEKGRVKNEMIAEDRKAAGEAKAPYVAAWVNTLIDAGERPLVFAWHHSVHDAIYQHLGKHHKRAAHITGKQSQSQKDEAVQAFGKGELDAILLSLRATAGLDGLQGMATCVVFAELDWSPAIHSQCEDRLHRIGIGDGLDSVLCYYLVSDTGFDETMQESLGLKISQFKGLMGDSAETQEDRALAGQDAQKHMDKIIERLRGAA